MSAAPSIPEGRLINGYRVGRLLGSGAMGEVYEAVREAIGRRVALKVVREETDASLNAARRLLEEARAVNVINHPGIVQIYDVGLMNRARPYLVMELLEGQPLSALIRGGPVPLEVSLGWLERVLSSLVAAHDAGVLHRDLKPSNVFVLSNRVGVKLLDFGVALRQGRAEVLTAAATAVGSIGFMAPEQLRGQAELASDLYAVGCLAFLLFTGRAVFPTRNVTENARLHLMEPAPRARSLRPELDARLDAWVASLLEKLPAHRPASADSALATLRAITGDGRERTDLVPAFTPPTAQRATRAHPPHVPPAGSQSREAAGRATVLMRVAPPAKP